MHQRGLADFIKEKMAERSLSSYDIARLSGDRVQANTITRILGGDIKEARLSTLEGIAIAFDMPIGDLVRISMGKSPKPSRFEIYAETFDAGDISEEEWSFLENYFRHHVDEFRAFKTAAAKRTKKA